MGSNVITKFDLDGQVFGMMDPPAMTITNAIPGGALVPIDQHGLGLFGDVTGSMDIIKGTGSFTCTNIPNPYIRRCLISGGVTNGYLVMQYTVDFNDSPSTALCQLYLGCRFFQVVIERARCSRASPPMP